MSCQVVPANDGDRNTALSVNFL